MAVIQCRKCGSTEIRYMENGLFRCTGCGAEYTPSEFGNLLNGKTETAPDTEELKQRLKNVRAFCEMGDFSGADELLRETAEECPERKEVWNMWLDAVIAYMRKQGRIPFRGSTLFDTPRIFRLGENADPSFRERKDAVYREAAQRIIRGQMSLFRTFHQCSLAGRSDPQTLSYDDLKNYVCEASEEMNAVFEAGEAMARRMQDMNMSYDARRTEQCFSFITPWRGSGVYYPVFALSDVIIGYPTDEPEANMPAVLIRCAQVITDTEEFMDDAVAQLIAQWENMDYCPYCYSRNVRRKMLKKEKVCGDCGRTIKPMDF